ncbi:MAG: hypothetical protein QM537_05010 [Candidatus Symbiobacter sp.]|nr:hypothetical protein [Candidatus Symbiobacter sp.]
MDHPPENPPAFEPKMRLFLSVDLIGSTAEKQEGGILPLDAAIHGKFHWEINPFPKWHDPIFNFFSLFDDLMNSAIIRYNNYCDRKNLDYYHSEEDQPKVWKRNGDEIIYTVLLKDAAHLLHAITMFLSVLRKYREAVGYSSDNGKIDKAFAAKKDKRLNGKATIWLAGFPIVNSEFAAQKSPARLGEKKQIPPTLANQYDVFETKNQSQIDFIGPSMDVGFRLTKLADYRKVPISFEIAYILALIDKNIKNKSTLSERCNAINNWRGEEQLYQDTGFFANFFYDGGVTLKGVFGSELYPHFWLRSPYTDIDGTEQKLLGKTACDTDAVLTRSEDVFNEKNKYLLRPFFKGCPIFGKEQPQYSEILSKWNSEFTNHLVMDSELEKNRSEFMENKPGEDLSDFEDVFDNLGLPQR